MSEAKQRIIGGVFGLQLSSETGCAEKSPFAALHRVYFLSARCAIYEMCRCLRPRTAWLPSYLCSAVIEPFTKLGVPIRYYDIGPQLKPLAIDWVEEVEPGDLAIVIHYFGFRNNALPAEQLRRRGGVILEDASQALFASQQYQESIGIIFSARKFFGVPDGGILVISRASAIEKQELEPPPLDWWTEACAVPLMRAEFDIGGGENRWFPLFKRVEESFPLGSYRCSPMAMEIIENGVDYQFMKKARRENYLELLTQLGEFALFPQLDDETIPLGFPVCIDASLRDRVLKQLYAQGIYPPVHWRLEGIVPEEHRDSHVLSRRVLTLICDQRYSIREMRRQADAFLTALH